MQIELAQKNQVELENGGRKILFSFDGQHKDGYDLVISAVPVDGAISRPGEYELSDVVVAAVETKEEADGRANLIKVEMGDAKALFLTDFVGELSKDDWNLVGDVDVLVVNMDMAPEDTDKFIKRLAPYIVFAINPTTDQEMEKHLGLGVDQKGAKFKVTAKDFEAEDSATTLRVLN